MLVRRCCPQVHYVGSFDDGTVFDSSREVGEPYEFLVGGAGAVPGFSEAVAGLGVGQSRLHTMTPADAYGEQSQAFRSSVRRGVCSSRRQPLKPRWRRWHSMTPADAPGEHRPIGVTHEA